MVAFGSRFISFPFFAARRTAYKHKLNPFDVWVDCGRFVEAQYFFFVMNCADADTGGINYKWARAQNQRQLKQ